MESKLTRLKSYRLLKQVYGDKPQPNWKEYEIELLRKAVKVWYHWSEEESKWILKPVDI